MADGFKCSYCEDMCCGYVEQLEAERDRLRAALEKIRWHELTDNIIAAIAEEGLNGPMRVELSAVLDEGGEGE